MIPTNSPIQRPNVYQTPAPAGPGIPGHCLSYFKSCVLIPRKLDAKCSIAKSCPGTHKALQAPMPDTPTISSLDCNIVIYSFSLNAIGAVQYHSFIIYMSNSCECMGVNGKPCSCMQFIKSHIFYCKSHKNLYQYYRSLENPYQVLQVTRAVSEHAMKLKVRMINHYQYNT